MRTLLAPPRDNALLVSGNTSYTPRSRTLCVALLNSLSFYFNQGIFSSKTSNSRNLNLSQPSPLLVVNMLVKNVG